MKLFRILPLLAFAAFLTIGFWVGAHLRSAPAAAFSAPQPTLPSLPSGQRRFLIVFVDDIQAEETRIQALLLLTYSPLYPYILPLPIYPSPAGGKDASEIPLATGFYTTPGRGLDPLLIQALHNKNLEWDGYILLDENALTHVIDLLGGAAINGQHLSAEDLLQELRQTAANPQETIRLHAALLDGLCQQLPSYRNKTDTGDLAEILTTYTRSDLNLNLVASEWLTLLGPGGKHTCNLAAYQIP
jgi:hypothetical protein